MRRLLIAFALGVGIFLESQGATSAQQPPSPQAPLVSIQATTVAELRTWDAFVTDGARSGSLRLRRVDRDPLLPARLVERFDQFHNGVKIWGADVVRDSERGVPLSIFGELSPTLQLSTDPALSEDEARTALLRLGGSDALFLVPPELVILRLDGGAHRLAYTAVVSGGGDVVRAFVDAQTGAELLRYTEIQRQQGAVGTGTGVLGDRKKLSVETNAGAYIAYDRHRPPIIQTFDMRGDPARTTLLLRRLLPYTVSDLARDADNVWTDVSIVDAHAHVSWTYDYYFKRFDRSGLDGRNGPIHILVNPVRQQDALFLSPDNRAAFALNAGFYPFSGPNGAGIMVFGSGIPSGADAGNGRNYTYFSGALDIAAHELTHAVTNATSGLIYHNESGALNEAFSDMMGKSVEFFYHPPGSGIGQADYVIGKDISRAVRAGALNGERSMANPRLYSDPDHYSGYVRLPDTPAGDNGGVHINSGIPNHAFYLAIEGGTNRTSGMAVQGVGAANREQIEKVFYRAFTTLMPSGATFATARATTIQAARDLYGVGGTAERAVTQAWSAVGVFPATALDISFTPNPAVASRQCQFGTVPCWKFAVTVQETGGQGFTVESTTSYDYDDAGRLLYPGWTYSFPQYFSGCGGGTARVAANGRACANWEWHLSGRSSGYTEFVFVVRSDDGVRRTFSNSLRLAR